MGMFDTIELETPLACPGCGTSISSLQTHELGDTMAVYRMGARLRGSPFLKGILTERLWCPQCPYVEGKKETIVYLVIWHSILAGVETDFDQAEMRLASIDRLDLIEWLDQAQQSSADWERKFLDLREDIRRWHEHLTRKDEPLVEGETEDQRSRRVRFRNFFTLPEAILSDPDPLGAILKNHSLE